MSGIQLFSPDPNILYKALSGTGVQEGRRNDLLIQHDQQTLDATGVEYFARAAQGLAAIGKPGEEGEAERAAAYPAAVAALPPSLRGRAPAQYMGWAGLQRVAALAVPAAEQYKQQGVVGAVDAYGNAIGISGVAPGTTTGVTAGGGGGTVAGGGSRTRPEGSGGPPAAGTPGAAVAQRTHDFWRGQGFDEKQIAGIMAGGPGSESDFDPSVMGDNGTSGGLYQHHGPRWEAMKQRYNTAFPTEAQQHEYAAWEIGPNGPPGLRGIADKLRAAKTPAEAATIWTRDFGRPGDVTEIDRRARGAGRYHGIYAQPQGAPGGPAPLSGVQMGGTPPGPPGAAPRPYVGGGFGTALNPVAPVVQAPPAPGGGTASNVPSDVNAMLGGMALARNTPVAGVQTAGPGAPTGPQQVASVELPPQPGWGTAVGSYGDGAVAAPPAAPPAAPVAPATTQQPAVPAATAPAQMPAQLQTDNNYLTDRDKRDLKPLFDQARRGQIPLTTLQNEVQQRQSFNVQRQKDWETRENTARTAAETRVQREVENTRHAEQLRISKEAAIALAKQREVENARAGVPTGMQRNAEGVIEPIPGYRGATAEERINYALKNDPPDSQEYTDAWRAKKWQMAPNGSVIEADMSEYPPPTRSVRRPTFLPQPTGTALDEVRKADTDARVIVPSIDRYVDLHKKIGGSSWGAYFDNPKDPKAQQLIGAFNAMKTVLRSPTYANTGVLQPAEMEMLKQELVSPQTIRGLYASPQALEARLHEIKFAILSRQDAELRSVGRDGVIVRSEADLANVPDGGKFYDEDGNLRVKTKAAK